MFSTYKSYTVNMNENNHNSNTNIEKLSRLHRKNAQRGLRSFSDDGLTSKKELGTQHFRILHFSDSPCVLRHEGRKHPGAARFVYEINKEKMKPNESGRQVDCIVLSSGGIFGDGFYSNFDDCDHMVSVMNRIGITCATFGLGEFQRDEEVLEKLTSECNNDWVITHI